MKPWTRSPGSYRRHTLAAFALLLPAAITAVALASGCDVGQTSDRRGGQGTSCVSTNDCQSPLSCIQNICGGPAADGGNENDAMVTGDGPSAEAGSWSTCDDCLDMKCATELAACGPDCIAIEACLEELCANLSEIGSAEEGMCQTNCQDQYPGGKDTHLDVVNCAIKATCDPPCTTYPDDFKACQHYMNKGDCGDELAACEASADCVAYRSCVGTCTTLNGCLSCSNTPDAAAGAKLFHTYSLCVMSECISESWLLNE
jgi:hypothetical protein